MGNVKIHLIEMLRLDAEAQKAKALLTLELLSNHASGIGDHSTGDFYKNAEEALQMLVDADDKLEAISKYFA
jgi:hypothetical protein